MRPVNKFMVLSLLPLSLAACSGAETTTASTAQLSPAAAKNAITLASSSVDIFHKHSATVNATIKGFQGTVNLRLEAPSDYPGTYSGPDEFAIALKTTTVSVVKKGTTFPLTLVASGLPNRQMTSVSEVNPQPYAYTVIASQNGKDVARGTITVNEKLLTVKASFEPASVGKGAPQNVQLVVTFTPPMEETLDVSLECLGAGPDSCYTSGPLSGTTLAADGTLRRTYSVNVPSEYGGPELNYSVYVSDFIKPGDQWYGLRYATLGLNQP